MPKVDGLTFLDKLMKARPTPVIIAKGMEQYRADIVEKIRSAAKANIKPVNRVKAAATCALKFKTTKKLLLLAHRPVALKQ